MKQEIEALLKQLDKLFDRHCRLTKYLAAPESTEAACNAGSDRKYVECEMLGIVNQLCLIRLGTSKNTN